MIKNPVIVHCFVCEKEISKYPCHANKKHHFCCKEHKAEGYSIIFSGINNPNYNKKWDDERRDQQSKLVKSKVDDVYRFKAGTANRGRIFSEEVRQNMSEGHLGKPGLPHSVKSKKIIGIKSKEKWTDDYKIKNREKMEENGHWIPLSQKTDLEIYNQESNWIERMWDKIEDPRDLIQTFGIFNNRTNSKGAVRDHILSRKTGLQLRIFPEILRHPENCQVLTHGENVRKRFLPEQLTFAELFNKIRNYKGSWIEQDKVLELIDLYEKGHRYVRKE